LPLTTGLPVSRLVKIDVILTSPAVTGEVINTCLVLGTTPAVIDATERKRSYGSLAEVKADFGTVCEEYYAADLWFAQNPSPTNLQIGRWIKTASPGAVVGAPLAPLDQLMSAWTTITNGGFSVTIDGFATPTAVSSLNFSSLTNLNAVANTIQTALRAAYTGTGAATITCVWNVNNDVFRITSGTTGIASAVTFLTSPAGPVQDVAALLKMRATDSGAYTVIGQAPETALAAVVLLDVMFSTEWYALVVPSATDSDHQQIAAYVEGADPVHYYGVTTSEAGSIVAATTTDIGYILHNFGYNKTAVQYSTSLFPGSTPPTPYAIMSYLARILTTQWTGRNTTITLMYKQEPGVSPENVTTTQADTLQTKCINAYVNYANGARLIEYGQSSSGEYTDTVIGADALALDLQSNLFNVMYTSPTKVPQTDPGMQLLVNAASATCAQYAGNGWLGSGTWQAQGFGTLKTGDLLPLGFYVYAPSMLTQSIADRAARKAPLMQIAAKCAGAIHTAEVVVYVNQ
jgi:hypothetical protein